MSVTFMAIGCGTSSDLVGTEIRFWHDGRRPPGEEPYIVGRIRAIGVLPQSGIVMLVERTARSPQVAPNHKVGHLYSVYVDEGSVIEIVP